jgi:hypothetical protein
MKSNADEAPNFQDLRRHSRSSPLTASYTTRPIHTQEVTGSSPVAPTILAELLSDFFAPILRAWRRTQPHIPPRIPLRPANLSILVRNSLRHRDQPSPHWAHAVTRKADWKLQLTKAGLRRSTGRPKVRSESVFQSLCRGPPTTGPFAQRRKKHWALSCAGPTATARAAYFQ